jgi:hypothetical protein
MQDAVEGGVGTLMHKGFAYTKLRNAKRQVHDFKIK